MLEFFQKLFNSFYSFSAGSFFLSLMARDKKRPFQILYKKYWIYSCITCLIRNSDTSMSLAMDLIDLLRSLSIMAWISAMNSRVLFLSEKSEWDFWVTIHSKSLLDSSNSFWILCTFLRLTHKHSEIFVLVLPEGSQVVQHTVSKFLLQWIASSCFPHRQCLTDSSLLHRRQNLKQSTCTKYII